MVDEYVQIRPKVFDSRIVESVSQQTCSDHDLSDSDADG